MGFSDVTLATEDGQLILAHKLILTSCSPVFENLLLKHNHPNPLIYLKSVSSTNLSAILDFVYLGETQIPRYQLNGFMELCRELQVSGLSEEALDDKFIKFKTENNAQLG